MTIKELKTLCEKEIIRGNGEKHILVPTDDEGNGYNRIQNGFIPIGYFLYDVNGIPFDDTINGYIRQSPPKGIEIKDCIVLE